MQSLHQHHRTSLDSAIARKLAADHIGPHRAKNALRDMANPGAMGNANGVILPQNAYQNEINKVLACTISPIVFLRF